MRKPNSVFKSFLYTILFAILLVYLLITLLFSVYMRQQARQIGEQRDSLLQNNAAILEQELESIYSLELSMLADNQIFNLCNYDYRDHYEKSQLIQNIHQKMEVATTVSTALKGIELYIPAEKRRLTTNTYISWDRKERDNYDFQKKERNLLLNEDHLELVLGYPLTYSILEDYAPQYLLTFQISNLYLQDLLGYFEGEQGDGAFLYFMDDNTGEEWKLTGESCGEKICELWKENKEDGKLRSEGRSYEVRTARIDRFGLYLVSYHRRSFLWESLTSLLIWMGLLLILTIVLFVLAIYRLQKKIIPPIHSLQEAFHEVRGGRLDVHIHKEAPEEFRESFEAFNDMTDRIGQLVEDVKEESKLRQDAELMQLQSQINPHFLYNSFLVIRYMARDEEYDGIVDFVSALAKYYRFINKEVHQYIPLSAEVEHMDCYLHIQQTRFGDRFTLIEDPLPEEVKNYPVPKLLLQPLVENAYNYGIHDMTEDGVVCVRYLYEAPYLTIRVEDNGGAMTEEKLQKIRAQMLEKEGEATRHAMNNVARRLEIAYGKPCMEVSIGEWKGLQIDIHLQTDQQPREV